MDHIAYNILIGLVLDVYFYVSASMLSGILINKLITNLFQV